MTVRSVVWIFAAVSIGVGALVPQPASGQAAKKSAFGSLSKNSNKPIDILADLLTIYDNRKLAVFQGNVRASQGSSTLQAAQLDVHYTGGAKAFTGQGDPNQGTAQSPAQPAAGQADDSQIKKIVASGNVLLNSEDNQTTKADQLVYDVPKQQVTVRGNVVINNEEDQTTTGDWAIYDVVGRKAVVGGNVVLSQGQNVLKGDRLNINLATGESRFANTGTTEDGSRRIRALLLPREVEKKPAEGANNPGGAAAQ